MKTYKMSWAAAQQHEPEHPERTAKRNAGGNGSLDFDVVFGVWPNRASMLKTIEMQGRRAPNSRDWEACQK